MQRTKNKQQIPTQKLQKKLLQKTEALGTEETVTEITEMMFKWRPKRRNEKEKEFKKQPLLT